MTGLTAEPINNKLIRLKWSRSTDIDVTHGGLVYIRHDSSGTDGTGSSGSAAGGAGIHSLPVHMNFPSGLYTGSVMVFTTHCSIWIHQNGNFRKRWAFPGWTSVSPQENAPVSSTPDLHGIIGFG